MAYSHHDIWGMSVKQLIDVVTKESGYELKNGEVSYHCPVCHHRKRKLQVNIETHKWKCWVCCKSHGTEGVSLKSLFRLFKADSSFFEKLKDFGYKSKAVVDKFVEHKPSIRLPNEFRQLSVPQNDIEHRHALAYLRNRNILKRDIIKYNIGYCTDGDYRNKIVIPSYDEFGNLNYFTGRTWQKDSPYSYKKPPYSSHEIIGFEFFINWNYPVYICEGVFDAITIKRNAIPLFGKIIGTKLQEKLMVCKPPTYIILDNDAKSDLIESCEKLLKYDIPLFAVVLKEKDPSEMGYKNIHQLIKDTRPLDFSDLIKLKLNL